MIQYIFILVGLALLAGFLLAPSWLVVLIPVAILVLRFFFEKCCTPIEEDDKATGSPAG